MDGGFWDDTEFRSFPLFELFVLVMFDSGATESLSPRRASNSESDKLSRMTSQ